jgi:hypothetical protein
MRKCYEFDDFFFDKNNDISTCVIGDVVQYMGDMYYFSGFSGIYGVNDNEVVGDDNVEMTVILEPVDGGNKVYISKKYTTKKKTVYGQ